MKTLSKITLMALALFISNGLSAQGKSGGRGNSPLKNHVKTVPIKTSEHARVTGSLNANAHANKIAKRNALAIITLEYLDKIDEALGTLYLLKLRKGKIYHVSFLKAFVLYYKYYNNPKFSFKK